jgi:3-phenylpropionate/trans-cinnamate dioxygenase ferredoxin reductase subunit
MTFQVAALAKGAATTIRCDLSAQAFILVHLDAGGRLLAASGFGPGNAIARAVHAHIHRRVFINRNKTIVPPASPGCYAPERVG